MTGFDKQVLFIYTHHRVFEDLLWKLLFPVQQVAFSVCNSKYTGNSVEVCALSAGLKSKWKNIPWWRIPTGKADKKIKGKNVILLILVIASRYTEVKPLASGHNGRLWNSEEYNLISFINPCLSMRYSSFLRKIVLCNFWQCQSILYSDKGLWVNTGGILQQPSATQKWWKFDGSV